MAFLFDHTRRGIYYKGHYIQTYSFGEGENIIFSLPSFPHSGIYYLWFLNYYRKKNVKFITFDIPGWIGDSENFLAEDFEISEFVQIAKYVLRQYKVEHFSIIGYSFGGALAIKLASEMKEKVKKLVIVSTIINGKLIDRKEGTKLKLILAYKLKMYRRVKNHILKTYKILSIIAEQKLGAGLLNLYTDMISHLDERVITSSAYQLFNNDWSQYLLKIKDIPTIIVNSKDEPVYFRQQAEYIRRHLKGEKSVYLHGTHDDFIINAQKEVVKKVIDFLAD